MRVFRHLVLVCAAAGCAAAWAAAELVAHEITVEGHHFRVWEKSPAEPRSRMLLIHGRTWSTRPDFDLQVPGEELSLMDGLVEFGVAAYGVDLRGYGETARDASGWLTPERAAADVAGVLEWLAAQEHPDLASGLIVFGYPVRAGSDRDPPEAAGEPPRRANSRQAARSDFLPDAISEDAVQAFVDAALAADPERMDWRGLEQWRRLDGARVRIPTLLLEAYHDPLAHDDVHQTLFTRLDTDDKVWVVIPGGGHAAFMERPRRYFLQQVRSFIHREP